MAEWRGKIGLMLVGTLAYACGIDVVGKINANAKDRSPSTENEGGAPADVDGAVVPSCGDVLASTTNCGACGRSCNGVACTNGTCPIETVASAIVGPTSIVADSTHYYVMAKGTASELPSVLRGDLSGGPPGTYKGLVEGGNGSALSGNLYFYGDSIGFWRLDLGTQSGDSFDRSVRSVGAAATTGFAATTFDNGEVWSVATNAADGFFSTGAKQLMGAGGSGRGITVDATNTYWANSTSNYIGRGSTKDGGGQILIPDQKGASAVVVDDANIYFTTESELKRAPKSAPTPTTLASGLGAPIGLVLDGGNLYWMDSTTGDVKRLPTAGGTPLVIGKGTGALASTQPYTNVLAIGGPNVYWISPTASTVLRVAK